MQLPEARGPVSSAVIDAVARHSAPEVEAVVQTIDAPAGVDLLTHDDLHLALWVLYELHYGGFEGVDPDQEWDPELLRMRAALEQPFEAELRRRTAPHVEATLSGDGDLARRLFDLSAGFDGPAVAKFVHRRATLEQFAEFMVHRSIYQLKESDPHSWVIPRISGKPKAALVELQYDEYGGGRPERLHATMFGDSMEGVGLDRTYGAYLDRVPGYTLANNNLMSLLGLHRRLRGAAMGHLGAYEATSSLPCRKYAAGVRRLGLPEVVAAYFDEHVEADAVHEQLAFRDICEALVTSGQADERDIVLGVTACLLMDAVVGERLLEAWEDGRSTLRGGAVGDVLPELEVAS
ncbi:MAG TPA: iron-containing redox enzyme family protein [Nocardioidaceae bacterium]|nr:iron-containing redox enzyme family protein [Nocardioidaceae bacterium]